MYKLKNTIIEKIILIIVLLGIMIATSNSTSCYLGVSSSNCSIFTNSQIEFSIQGDNIDRNHIEIYEDKTSNRVKYENNEIKNSFKYPGVYKADITSIDLAGQVKDFNTKEFVFDNTQPSQPVVDSIIYGAFEVTTQYPQDEVIIKNKAGETIDSSSTSQTANQFSGLSQQQYIEIYSKRNELLSEPVKRYYYPNQPKQGSILGESLSINREIINQVNHINNGKTSQRQFFITGSASGDKGKYVRVNGQKIPIMNGSFGAFEILNTGENKIEILGNNEEKIEYNVEYIPNNFQFSNLEIEKIITDSTITISGKTSNNAPFLLYVGGEFYQEITPSENKFSIEITGVDKEKTFIEMRGYNGEHYKTIVYKDTQSPTIEPLHEDILTANDNLWFLIKDDIGINESSIKISINGRESEQWSKKGNFYQFPLENVSNGEYEIDLSLKDRAGNQNTYSGSITQNSNAFQPLNMTFSNGADVEKIGNHLLFSNKKETQLTFSMNEAFAFEHIFVDNREVIDYEIYQDDTTLITLPRLNETGTITMRYMNGDNNYFSKNYTYEVIEKQEASIDSPTSPTFSNGNAIEILPGEIENSTLIDKNSFEINGRKPMWFNDKFELYGFPSNTLEISGKDIFGRDLESTIEQQVFEEELPKGKSSSPKKHLSMLYDYINHQLYYMKSVNGIDLKNSYMVHDQNYPGIQKQGVQAHNVEVMGSAGSEDSLYFVQTLDSIPPKVYLKNASNPTQIIIDGTGSKIVKDSVEFNGAQASNCENENPYEICYEFTNSLEEISLDVFDEAGNNFSQTIELGSIQQYRGNQKNNSKIYFSGVDGNTSRNTTHLQGQYISQNYPESITTQDGVECQYDQYNFICPVNLDYGENYIDVIINTQEGNHSKTKKITRPQINETLRLDEIVGGNNVYRQGDLTYYFGGEIQLRGENTMSSPLTIEINNRPVNTQSSDFPLSLNSQLSPEIQGVKNKEITLQAKTTHEETGEEIRSNRLEMLYSKLKDLLVSIKLE